MNTNNDTENAKPKNRVGFMVGRSAFVRDLHAQGFDYPEIEKRCKAQYPTSSPSMIKKILQVKKAHGSGEKMATDTKPKRRTLTLTIDGEIYTRLEKACQEEYKGMVSASRLAAALLTERVKLTYQQGLADGSRTR